MEKKWQAITCPHCGREYSPCEIFMPGDVIGKAQTVVRDPDGKIMHVEWEEGYEPAQTQTYVCDGCGRTFVATACASYESAVVPEEEDFAVMEVSLL